MPLLFFLQEVEMDSKLVVCRGRAHTLPAKSAVVVAVLLELLHPLSPLPVHLKPVMCAFIAATCSPALYNVTLDA